MKTEIKFKPGFAVVHVNLQPGETITAESDAMASMSTHLKMKTKFNGGFLRGLVKKFFGSESLFVNDFTCPINGKEAEIVLTQPTPGDICELELNNSSFFLQPGAFIASVGQVTLGVKWAGLASWINKEGLFKLEVKGTGKVFFGAYGCIIKRKVTGGFVVDSGHLVGYSKGITLKMGLAGGIFSSFFGGEGIVSRLNGDGEIYLQTRNLSALATLTNKYL